MGCRRGKGRGKHEPHLPSPRAFLACLILQIGKWAQREEASCQSPRKMGERWKGGGEGEDKLEKGKVKAARMKLWVLGLGFFICKMVT